MKIATLTVGLRDDMDAYYQKHKTIPSRAWVLSRIMTDADGQPLYTEDEVRDLPLAEVEAIWQEFQEALNPLPLSSATDGPSSTG